MSTSIGQSFQTSDTIIDKACYKLLLKFLHSMLNKLLNKLKKILQDLKLKIGMAMY